MADRKTNKRADITGFCQATMQKRTDAFKKYKGGWRHIDKKTIVATILLQTWTHVSGRKVTIKHLCPWGMKEFQSRLLLAEKCKTKQFLPYQLKTEAKELCGEKYKKEDWTISISNTGPQEPKSFNRLYCTHCHSILLPKLYKQHEEALGSNQTVASLVANWDILKIPDQYSDFVGCFLPWNESHVAGPNARRFIREPNEHPKTTHIYTTDAVPKKREQKQAALAVPSKVIALDKDGESSTSSSKQSTFTGKSMKKQTFIDNQLYTTDLDVKGPSLNEMAKFAKEFCLSVVHTSCLKMLSNIACIEHYETAISGMQKYHEQAKAMLNRSYPHAKLIPPIKLALNKHNIVDVQRCILDTYRYDESGNIFSQMRKSPFWSLMHDGIAKFGMELNGVCIRALNEENEPISVPYCLQRMPGGVTGMDTAQAIIKNICDVVSIDVSAFDEIMTYLKDREIDDTIIHPVPPNYFKLGKLMDVDEDSKEIHITLDSNMPVSNTGDGVSVNVKGARVLRELHGIYSPDYRCAAHSADGTLKRLTKSKTMNVPEVTILYECLRTVVKHFESSIKNKELLDECMEILEMTPLNLISWCQTRMAHFLKSCSVVNVSLPALYDAMYTKGIRIDERDLLFTANNIFIMKVLADIEPLFQKCYLRKADKTNCLVSTVFTSAENFAEKMESIETVTADAFKESLQIDENGNLLAHVNIKNNVHTLMLNHPHKPTRNVSEEQRLVNIKDSLALLKDKIVQNMVQNIRDQCNEETFYYSWSGIDLEITDDFSTADRLSRMNDLFTIFCTEKVHQVKRYTDVNETKTEPDQWNGYGIYLHHQRRIHCEIQQLKKQTRYGLQSVSALWLK